MIITRNKKRWIYDSERNFRSISKQWCSLDDLMKLGQFGRLLNSNIKLLEKEGIYVTKIRSAKERLYTAYYEEVLDED